MSADILTTLRVEDLCYPTLQLIQILEGRGIIIGNHAKHIIEKIVERVPAKRTVYRPMGIRCDGLGKGQRTTAAILETAAGRGHTRWSCRGALLLRDKFPKLPDLDVQSVAVLVGPIRGAGGVDVLELNDDERKSKLVGWSAPADHVFDSSTLIFFLSAD